MAKKQVGSCTLEKLNMLLMLKFAILGGNSISLALIFASCSV